MNESDPSFAKKRLGRDLRVLVLVQVAALCVFGAGLYLWTGERIPNNPKWDEIHLLCGSLALFGAIVFVVAAFWGFGKLTNVNFLLPSLIRNYLWGVGGILVSFVLLVFFSSPFSPPICSVILLCIFPFYSVIPQFFIARWLTKEAETI